ncbi:MAG: hypothetical protein GY862_07805 [Gammaproteobacteria bacterium]|nr:hypothetical protein [Gammaproteobacteria bacterium]
MIMVMKKQCHPNDIHSGHKSHHSVRLRIAIVLSLLIAISAGFADSGDNYSGGINHAGSGTLSLNDAVLDNNTAAPRSGVLFAGNNGGGIKNDGAFTLAALSNEQSQNSRRFSAGGHIADFRDDGVYLASSRYMLNIRFAGASHAVSVSSKAGSAGKAAPLQQINYQDLWPGISLTYESAAKGLLKSTYELKPGADSQRILLSSNVPLRIDSAGNLRFQVSGGELREDAPIAWQDINGQRIPVKASWRLHDSGEAGFALGQYNARYPLVIDPLLSVVWNTTASNDGYLQ